MSSELNAPRSVLGPTVAERTLVPALSARCALGGIHVAVVAACCAVVLLLNHLPLRSTDLWGHVIFGNVLLDTHRLPTTDPTQPLADGMRVVDLQWLAQLALAGTYRLGGPEALVGLFTLVVAGAYLVLGRAVFLTTRSLGLSAVVTGLVFLVGWNRVATIRPENFAMLLFAVLLWMLAGRQARRADLSESVAGRSDARMWIGLPLIALLWVNLHGSFPVMFVVLGCVWLGRVIETAWQSRSVRVVLADAEVRRLTYCIELSLLATLLNPYGLDAWIEAVRFSSNPNLRDVLEWNPLVFLGPGGREFAAACVVTALAWRHSRRTVAAAEVLLLAAFGLGAIMQVRMTGWFAFVWGVTMAPHLADVASQVRRRRATSDNAQAETPTGGLAYKYTLACVGLLWITFAFTTFSRPLLGGSPRNAIALYGADTPLGAAAWLRSSPIEGQSFNPQYWGDWFAWTVPNFKPFATTNVHLLPSSVWTDYQRIARAEVGWDATLERYAVRTVVIDRAEQASLRRALRGAATWESVYEDEQSQIFRRRDRAKKS